MDVFLDINRTDGYKRYVIKGMPNQRGIDIKKIGKGRLLEKKE